MEWHEQGHKVSAINKYEEGGLKMTYLNCMIKSLRLAWIKCIFDVNNGTWKSYLQHLLDPTGGLFFLRTFSRKFSTQ